MPPKRARSTRLMREARLQSLPDVLTISQTARFLGIGRNTAYEAARRGELPCLRIGKRILVPKQALEQRLASTLRSSTTDHV